ncbi:MAG: hypothetical protein M0019_00775, partial [Actinomycetota bacterium]|nr:hypothetical protein [Actinomycetota bacterium]
FLIRALLGELYCSQADLISYTGFGYVDVVLGKKKVKMCASWGWAWIKPGDQDFAIGETYNHGLLLGRNNHWFKNDENF